MIDVKDILARLQKGEAAESIADEFTNAINEAIKINDAEKLKQKQEKEAARERENLLNAKAEAIVAAINDYIATANPDLARELADSDEAVYETADVRNMIDSALAAVRTSLSLVKHFTTPNTIAGNSPDESIRRFLATFVD